MSRARDDAVLRFIPFYRMFVNLVGPERSADLAHMVFKSWNRSYAFALFCKMGQLRAEYLKEKGISEAGAYKALKDLRDLGLIEPAEKIQVSNLGGQRTQIWRLRCSDSERGG